MVQLSLSSPVTLVLGIVVTYSLSRLLRFLLAPYFSSLRILPGPPSPSWIFGNLKQIFSAEAATLQEVWVEQYGITITYKGWFNSNRLFTMDTRALNHVLLHANDYCKSAQARLNVSRIVGQGILFVEAHQHRAQRRVMNPAFGPAQIREVTDIFISESIKLREYWFKRLPANGAPARINVSSGLSQMTLDVIGLAGFNYNFDALSGKPNELNEAFKPIFASASMAPSLKVMLGFLIPPLRYILPDKRAKLITSAKATMDRIGMQLIQEKKAEVLSARSAGEKEASLESRDLLTLLIKANMATDLPESQRMSDEDVLAQVPTFLVAGHETTSNATSWCLFALATAPEVQRKLREELLNVATETPSMDDLNDLPYLESVVRETMRVHTPVPQVSRVAQKDDVIPLSTPFTDIYGNVHDSIRIDKGTTIDIPLLAINRSKALWGNDSFEFKPERWDNVPEAVHSVPGVWSHLMTFFGGAHTCIGYRFSLIEMKAILFVLVRAFEFELAVPADAMTGQNSGIRRPLVKGEVEKGIQMPMLIRPYRRA